jgi:spore germination protein GerM
VVFVERVIDEGADPLVASFELLVAGPSADESKDGLWSWFSDETTATVRSVELDNGLLVVDFDNFIEAMNNAGTSCGSESLLAQLNGTAFQFTEVERVTYGIEGSCETFFNWLQRDCVVYHRP